MYTVKIINVNGHERTSGGWTKDGAEALAEAAWWANHIAYSAVLDENGHIVCEWEK